MRVTNASPRLVRGRSADEAYRYAGYKPSRANASTLRANQNIQDRVSELLRAAADRVEITAAKVLDELWRLGSANMLDYIRTTEEGDAYVDLSALDRDKAAAIVEMTVEEYKDGRGKDARDVRRVKFKLADKRAALVDCGKALGMFTVKVEHSGAVNTEIKDPDAARALIARHLERQALLPSPPERRPGEAAH